MSNSDKEDFFSELMNKILQKRKENSIATFYYLVTTDILFSTFIID